MTRRLGKPGDPMVTSDSPSQNAVEYFSIATVFSGILSEFVLQELRDSKQ